MHLGVTWPVLVSLLCSLTGVTSLRGSELVLQAKAKQAEEKLNPVTEEVTVEVGEDGNTTVVVKTKPLLTGIPQKDYIYDPNLPRELKGHNLTDYPFYNALPPDIEFECDGLHDGFYASVPHHCQVYHHCLFGTRYDFLCANYTAFDQKTFICHFVSEIDCANSPKYYKRNEALYKQATSTSPPTTTTTTTTTTTPPPRRDQESSGRRRRPFRRRRPAYDYYYDDEAEEYDDYYEDEEPLPPRKGNKKNRPGGGGKNTRRRPPQRKRPIRYEEDDYYDDEEEDWPRMRKGSRYDEMRPRNRGYNRKGYRDHDDEPIPSERPGYITGRGGGPMRKRYQEMDPPRKRRPDRRPMVEEDDYEYYEDEEEPPKRKMEEERRKPSARRERPRSTTRKYEKPTTTSSTTTTTEQPEEEDYEDYEEMEVTTKKARGRPEPPKRFSHKQSMQEATTKRVVAHSEEPRRQSNFRQTFTKPTTPAPHRFSTPKNVPASVEEDEDEEYEDYEEMEVTSKAPKPKVEEQRKFTPRPTLEDAPNKRGGVRVEEPRKTNSKTYDQPTTIAPYKFIFTSTPAPTTEAYKYQFSSRGSVETKFKRPQPNYSRPTKAEDDQKPPPESKDKFVDSFETGNVKRLPPTAYSSLNIENTRRGQESRRPFLDPIKTPEETESKRPELKYETNEARRRPYQTVEDNIRVPEDPPKKVLIEFNRRPYKVPQETSNDETRRENVETRRRPEVEDSHDEQVRKPIEVAPWQGEEYLKRPGESSVRRPFKESRGTPKPLEEVHQQRAHVTEPPPPVYRNPYKPTEFRLPEYKRKPEEYSPTAPARGYSVFTRGFSRDPPKTIDFTAPGPSAPGGDITSPKPYRTNDYNVELTDEEYDVTLNDALQPSTLVPTRTITRVKSRGYQSSVTHPSYNRGFLLPSASQQYYKVEESTDDGDYEAVVVPSQRYSRLKQRRPTEWYW